MGSRADCATDSAVLRCLAAAPRRRVLRLLRDRAAPVEVDGLAAALAAREQDEPLPDVARDEVRRRLAALRHDYLPRLAAADLVTWNRDRRSEGTDGVDRAEGVDKAVTADGTVAPAAHPALDHPALERVVAEPSGDWDAVLEILADDRRRAILAVLRDRGGVMGRAELAARIVARERARCPADGGSTSGASDDVGTVESAGNDAVLSLHHVHLPKLERASLLAYDPEDGTVSYQGDGTLADDLLGDGTDDLLGDGADASHGSEAPSSTPWGARAPKDGE